MKEREMRGEIGVREGEREIGRETRRESGLEGERGTEAVEGKRR